MKNIAKKVEAIRKELNEPIPEPQNPKEKKMATKKKKGAKKVSKKKSKRGAKKKTSAKKSKADGGISLAALAKEAGITGQKARQKLRGAGIEREEGGRWSWKEGSKALKAARKAIGL